MVELIGLGIVLADPKRIADLDANCWNGWLRAVIVELQGRTLFTRLVPAPAPREGRIARHGGDLLRER
jgi:hypothetical protein